MEAFRDENGKSRQRVIESCGKLDSLLKDNPNALEDLRARARQLTAAQTTTRGTISFDTTTASSLEHPVIKEFQVCGAEVSLSASGSNGDGMG